MRSGNYDHWWIVKIAGTDQSALKHVIAGTVQVTLNKAGEPSTAVFRTVGITPTEGQAVSIASGAADHLVFGGTIARVSQVSVLGYASNQWDVECIDYSYKVNEYLVFREYPAFNELNNSWTAEGIIADILATFSPSGNWTRKHVVLPPDYMTISFAGETVYEAIQRVVAKYGGECFFDPTGDLWAYQTHPWSPVQVDMPTTPKLPYGRLTYQRDLTQARTRALVKGARTTTAIDYDYSLAPSANKDVPLVDDEPFIPPAYVRETAPAVAGISRSVWIRNRRYDLAAIFLQSANTYITSADANPGDTVVTFTATTNFYTNYFTDGQQYLAITGTSGPTGLTVPASGIGAITTKIPSGTVMRGVPSVQMPINPLPAGLLPRGSEVALCVEVINTAAETAIAALLTDGTHPSNGRLQTVIDDDTLRYDAAVRAATAATANSGQVGVAGTIADFPSIICRAGQRIHVSIAARSIAVDAKITSVTMATREGAARGRPVARLDFSTRTEWRAFRVLSPPRDRPLSEG